MTTFRHRTPEKFSRISDLEWEKWKPIILEKYQSSTLEEVTDHMEKAYGFIATPRQYGHRLRDVWNVRKYGRAMSSAASKTNLCGSSEAAGQYESGATQPYLQPVDDTVDEPRPQLTTSDYNLGTKEPNSIQFTNMMAIPCLVLKIKRVCLPLSVLFILALRRR
ncbi:hypothetical protein P885DRAFT_60663 [Corynascus similis CBS 632.67]